MMCDPKTIDFGELSQLGMCTSQRSSTLLDQAHFAQNSDLLLPSEVEEYFEELGKKEDDGQPLSPFFGRTTPQLYGDDDDDDHHHHHDDVIPRAHPANVALRSGISSSVEEDHYPDFRQLGLVANESPFAEHTSELSLASGHVESDPDLGSCDVNEKLRRTIQERRRKRGKGEINLEEDIPDYENVDLTPKETERIKRRRESNRRAAAKSRIKKREEQKKLLEKMEKLEEENKELKRILTEHLEECSNPDRLARLLQQSAKEDL